MDALLQIAILVAFLAGGAALARLRAAPPPAATDFLIKLVLRALLAVMGFRLGNDRAVFARIGEIGLLAGATAVFALLGSFAALFLAFAPALRAGRAAGPALHAPKPAGSARRASRDGGSAAASGGFLRELRAPLRLIAWVLLGLVAGLILPPAALELSGLSGWALNALLFLIGMQFVQAKISLGGVFLRPETLLVPLATALGSLAGGLALVPLFGLSAGKALALAGGFGWYSLSGVLIADLGDPALGSAAFLANMVRESIALALIPFLASSRFPALAIGAGGATAMDVTLPLIEQAGGPELVPLSFASGALLSLSVPFLVPLCFGLG
jgi:uncharacterized membrane protein YbjE (DUF340 family)